MPSSILALSALLNVTSQQESHHIQQDLLPVLVRIVREEFLLCPHSQELGVGLLRLQETLGHDNDGVAETSILNAIWNSCHEQKNNKKKIAERGVDESYSCIRQFSDAELGL